MKSAIAPGRSKNSLPPVLAEDWRNGGFGIYVHWPFCESKCPYCDFNSHVAASVDHDAWRNAYLSELERYAAETGPRIVHSVFFGGGTPSLMAPSTTAAILDRIGDLWTLANDVEITLEANPGSVEAEKFRAFADAGVNRVSLGLQSLNDEDLRRLGRLHSANEGRRALEIAKSSFDRVSFDLIYARQYQSENAWIAELNTALDIAGEHLSLYQLTIEDGTAFGDRYARGGLKGLPEEDRSVALFELTQELCHERGFHRYEVSNYAKPTAESRHNLIYWRYGDYLGIGPGAHGRITLDGQKFATETALNPATWLTAAKGGHGEARRDALSAEDMATEYAMMSLRLAEGMSAQRYHQLGGKPLDPERISELTDLGLIKASDAEIIVSKQGLMVLNSVVERLLRD